MTTEPARLDFPNARFSRVLLTDAPVPPEVVGLSAAQIEAQTWADERLAADGQVMVGVGAWVAEIDGQRMVFDPLQAADSVLRADAATEGAIQDQVTALLTEAGFPPASVDAVALTHIDGVGMVARRDGGVWSPFFPNARILLSEAELEGLLDALEAPSVEPEQALVLEAWRALLEAGVVDGYADGAELAPGLVAAVSGGHGSGHAVFHYRDGEMAPDGPVACTFIGHLALSPLHLATGVCEPQHEDPERAHALLEALIADGRTLIGPLWPSPGFGRWLGDRVALGSPQPGP